MDISAGEQEIPSGTVLVGRYELERRLGAGGMASVYRATDRLLNRHVAVKVLQQKMVPNAGAVRKFFREAERMAALDSPHVVPIYDVGRDGPHVFLVMKLLAGPTLQDVIDREAPLSPARAIPLVAQLLVGLEHLHEKGLVHRDVKPSNIIITGDEARVVLLDLGIARPAPNRKTHTTEDRRIYGTPEYMAPERVTDQQVDARSDLYAVGIILFEALTGYLPFDGETPMQICVKQLSSPPPSPRQYVPAMPDALVEVILRALRKEASRRYQSATEMHAALEQVLTWESGRGAATDTGGLTTSGASRHRTAAQGPTSSSAATIPSHQVLENSPEETPPGEAREDARGDARPSRQEDALWPPEWRRRQRQKRALLWTGSAVLFAGAALFLFWPARTRIVASRSAVVAPDAASDESALPGDKHPTSSGGPPSPAPAGQAAVVPEQAATVSEHPASSGGRAAPPGGRAVTAGQRAPEEVLNPSAPGLAAGTSAGSARPPATGAAPAVTAPTGATAARAAANGVSERAAAGASTSKPDRTDRRADAAPSDLLPPVKAEAPSDPSSFPPVAGLPPKPVADPVTAARSYLAAGDTAGALRVLEQAVTQPPVDPEVYMTMGDTHSRTGNRIAAIAAYRRYLAVHPEGPGAERARSRLAELGGR